MTVQLIGGALDGSIIAEPTADTIWARQRPDGLIAYYEREEPGREPYKRLSDTAYLHTGIDMS